MSILCLKIIVISPAVTSYLTGDLSASQCVLVSYPYYLQHNVVFIQKTWDFPKSRIFTVKIPTKVYEDWSLHYPVTQYSYYHTGTFWYKCLPNCVYASLVKNKSNTKFGRFYFPFCLNFQYMCHSIPYMWSIVERLNH